MEAACNALGVSSPLLNAGAPLFGQVRNIINGDNSTQEDYICSIDAIRELCMDACEKAECETGGDTPVDIAYAVAGQIFAFTLIFGLAGTVDFEHFKQRFRSRGVYIGLACQFVMMPFVGFCIVAIFIDVFTPLQAVTLMIITSSPGGSGSNWLCNFINADLALSVAMTTVSTVMSVAMLPLNIVLYIELGYKRLDPENSQAVVALLPYEVIGYTLANVLTAVTTGLYFGYRYPQYVKYTNTMANISGITGVIVSAVASTTSCAKPWELDVLIYVGICLPVILAVVLTIGIAMCARIPKPQVLSVAIETGFQNVGIATAVVLTLGPQGRAAAIVPIVYGLCSLVSLGVLSFGALKMGWTLSPKDEPIWKVLFDTYQHRIDGHPLYAGYHGDDGAGMPSDKRLSSVVGSVVGSQHL